MIARQAMVFVLLSLPVEGRGAAGEDGLPPAPSDGDIARAQDLDRAAESATEAGRYDEAIRDVLAAERIVSTPIHLLNLGMINERACRVTAAMANFFEYRQRQDCDHVPEGTSEARYCEDAQSRIVHERETRQACAVAAPPPPPHQPEYDPAARRRAKEQFRIAETSTRAGDEDAGAAWEQFNRTARCAEGPPDPEIARLCDAANRRIAELGAREREAARRAQAAEDARRRRVEEEREQAREEAREEAAAREAERRREERRLARQRAFEESPEGKAQRARQIVRALYIASGVSLGAGLLLIVGGAATAPKTTDPMTGQQTSDFSASPTSEALVYSGAGLATVALTLFVATRFIPQPVVPARVALVPVLSSGYQGLALGGQF